MLKPYRFSTQMKWTCRTCNLQLYIFLRISLPLRSPGIHKIVRCTERVLLRLLICDVHHKKAKIDKESEILGEETRALVNAEQWSRLEAWCNITTQNIGLDTKAKQIQKFERLQAKQRLAPRARHSGEKFQQQTLAEKEKAALALGLNFSVAPKQIPTFEMTAATEATASRLNAETAQLLRYRVSSILSMAKDPKSNLSKDLHKAVKSLRKDKSITILPADKGS